MCNPKSNTLLTATVNQEEITDQAEIHKQALSFYQSLVSCKGQIQTDEIVANLEKIPLQNSPMNKHSWSSEELFKSLKHMENNKLLKMMGTLKNSRDVSGTKSKKHSQSLFIKHF